MEETGWRVDYFKQELADYEKRVKNIQIAVWERLDNLNGNKDFQQLHKDNIRRKGLTKLEETSYLLGVIDDIDVAKSAEVDKEINYLKEANKGLEHHCGRLKSDTHSVTKLLEQAESENNLLIKRLKEAEKDEGDIEKELYSNTELKKKDKVIKRLKTELEQTRWNLYANLYVSKVKETRREKRPAVHND